MTEIPKKAHYDVFLSHNNADKLAVEEIGRRLVKSGIQPFLDKWHLIPGEPWQEAIEDALNNCDTCVVFVGPSGTGPWQNEEMRAAIDRRVNESKGVFRVIPVLLPGAMRGERSRLPTFLVATTWVEFRNTLDDENAFHRLVCGVRGQVPGPGPGEAIYEGMCPYRGLQVFDVEHAPFFFGREALTEWLLDALRPPSRGLENRFLAIIGPSGSGKSSLARAGLVAALQHGRIAESDKWPTVICRPGPNPLESLAIALSSYTSDSLALADKLSEDERRLHFTTKVAVHNMASTYRFVLLVDQFEELFTLCHNDTLRHAFIDNLLYAANVIQGQTIVLLTLRADFYARCATYPRLTEALSDHQVLVGVMTEKELRLSIERPAELMGLEFEPGLVDVLLHDVQDQPGYLPLLQHTLLELWNQRSGRYLTHTAYQTIGGIAGALERRADTVYESFTLQEREICRRVFLRMTQPGEGTEDTKRRVSLQELLPAEEELQSMVENVIQALAGADTRLVTVESNDVNQKSRFIEVAHEALVREWSRLREWVEEDRAALRVQHKLAEAAIEWERHNQESSFLYLGVRLAEAEEWMRFHKPDMSSLEQAFLTASIALRDEKIQAAEQQQQREHELEMTRKLAEETEARRQAEQQRAKEAERREQEQAKTTTKFRWLSISLTTVLIIAVGLAFVIFFQSKELQQQSAELQIQRDEFQSLNLALNAQQALLDNDDDFAVALAVEANQIDDPPAQSQRVLAEMAYPVIRRRFSGHTDWVWSVAFSPDGLTALSGSFDNSVRLWDLRTGTQIHKLYEHDKAVRSVAFSPDGKMALSASSDNTLILWDIEEERKIHQLRGHTDEVMSVVFSPDGQTALSGSYDRTLILWDVNTGSILRSFVGHSDRVSSVAISSDGRIALSGSHDKSLILWDVSSGEAIHHFLGHTAEVWSVALSPDGQTALSGAADHSVILWDVESGKQIHQFKGHSSWVYSVAFSPDGRFAVSGSADGSLIIWDIVHKVMTRRLNDDYRYSQDEIFSVAFSPDEHGYTILSGSRDRTLKLWNRVAWNPEISQLTGHSDAVSSVVFHPNRNLALSGSRDHSLILWNVNTGEVKKRFMGHTNEVSSVAFNPADDGQTALSASHDHSLILWDVENGTMIRRFDGHTAAIRSVAFSPDGKIALSGGGDAEHNLRLWEVETGEQIGHFDGHTNWVTSVAFSSDGRTALSGSHDHSMILWDVDNREVIHRFEGHDGWVTTVAFSPSPYEKLALSGSADGSLILWGLDNKREIHRLTGHEWWVWDAAFSPDGQRILSSSSDHTMILWDTESGGQLRRFYGHTGEIYSVAFSPDGRLALSGAAGLYSGANVSSFGVLRLWQIHSLDELIDWTCRNRYIPKLTCEDALKYHITESCDQNTVFDPCNTIEPQN